MEQATAHAAREVAGDFYRVLLELDAGTLGVLARGPLRVDDPLFGRWEGDAFADRFEACARWLEERSAAFIPGEVTVSGARAVREWVLYLAENGRDIELPVAVVAESSRDSMSVRVYHSTWPLAGRHRVRAPLLPCDQRLDLPDVVGEYHRALRAGDAAAILSTFREDSYAREPAGGEFEYRGRDRLREFYRSMLGHGGIELDYCTVTDDGTRCALEYVARRWGGHDLPEQAGVAVYERGSDGRLAAARIYDDVEPPA